MKTKRYFILVSIFQWEIKITVAIKSTRRDNPHQVAIARQQKVTLA